MVATVTRLSAAASTVHYFEADGYYARGDPEHRRASAWHGQGVKALGLHGPVKPQRFEALLAGYVPGTGIRLGRLRDGEHQHRPGVDVTFSAPKSISLEALVYAAPRTGARVVRAHDEAVRAALDFIERELLQTRDYDRATGRRPRVKAHGLVAATFRHVASRNLDPQLHTHAVIANVTRNREGAWRSAEFTAIERSKHLIGAVYRHELRARLEAIGYATVPSLIGRVPGFEIAGYARALLDAFSTRRRDLLAYLRDRGWAYTPARAQQAALFTRRRKAEPDRRVLAAAWRARARELGPARSRDAARGRNGASRRSPPLNPPSVLSVAQRAVEHLEERRTVLPANDIRAFALAQAQGRYSLHEIDHALFRLHRDGHLIEATARRADRAFVTDRARAAERELLVRLRSGLDAGEALVSQARVKAALVGAGLNAGQSEAVRTIALSTHRTVGVQGHAGSGKTTMLRTVAALAGERTVVGLAPSAAAARVLATEAGFPARTLQGFLARYRDVGDGIAAPEAMAEARRYLESALLILDEASMVGTTQMRELMRIAEQARVARLALVGDRRQLRAVEAGAPFTLLQDAGMPTARMDTILRQRDGSLKAAVHHLLAGQPRLAVEELGNGVLETESDALGETAAALWLDLDSDLREGTALLAPTHALRADINEAVRFGLAREGVLHGPELELERYVNLRLTRAQKGESAHYRPGDVAVFHHDVYGVRARSGDACRVLEVEEDAVRLAHPDGRERRIQPSGYIRYRLELYETEPMVIRAGDRVRWTRNDPSRGLLNGERAEVLTIGPVNVRMRLQDGQVVTLPRDDPQLHHLDYAYSSTVHGAQGMTCERVVGVLDTYHGAVADQAAFYVELTRARDRVVLLTDDREALIESLETARGEGLSALKAIGEQYAIAPEVQAKATIPEKAPVLDEATRAHTAVADLVIDHVLSAAQASLEAHATRGPAPPVWDEGFRAHEQARDAWRRRARRVVADCRRVLASPRLYASRLAEQPGAEARIKRSFRALSAALAAEAPEETGRSKTQTLERRRTRSRGLSM